MCIHPLDELGVLSSLAAFSFLFLCLFLYFFEMIPLVTLAKALGSHQIQKQIDFIIATTVTLPRGARNREQYNRHPTEE